MLMRVCDICKREIRKTEGRYKLVYIGRLYDTDKDVCADCIKRIADEIKKADTPQTTLCRECDDYAGDGMYCASNYIVYDFSTSRENCEADTRQTNIDKAKADIAKWSSWSKTYESMCESQTEEEFEEPNYYDPALWE